jgi:hypothetical protein
MAPAPAALFAAVVNATMAAVVGSISPAPDKEAASVEVIDTLMAATVVLLLLLLLLPLFQPLLSVVISC